ncbi:AbrB family transcriptional regulator [Devosia sp.]|uniref:AbrB family transcriptional regulator n=1 Tax=Devosia sp. TaxID=1871048 RepID=UPI003A936E62
MSDSPAADVLLRRLLVTIAISFAGGTVATLLHMPASWLAGGALAVAVASLSGVRTAMPDRLRDLIFTCTGLSMGASVAKDSLQLMAQWPVTLVALAIELILIISLTGYLLRRVFKLDKGTAYLSSFPGHLSFVMSIAAAGVGDSRQIIIIQVIRILLLTICVPIGAVFLPVGEAPIHATEIAQMPLSRLALVLVACWLTGWLFTWLKVPAAFALGAMATSITAKFLGFFDGALPPWFLIGTFGMVGALIGSRFAGITRSEFVRALVGGLAGTALTVAITTLVAAGAAQFVDMPFGQIWIGLSPGALEGMGALGVALGFDTAFIAAHHVSRLLMLTVAIPLVAMLVRKTETGP